MGRGASLRPADAAIDVDMHIVLAYSGSATYGIRLRGKRAEELIVPGGYPLRQALDGADVQATSIVATAVPAVRSARARALALVRSTAIARLQMPLEALMA